MSKIQKVPPGLLSFLGIVGDGQLPSTLSDTVAPVVDLSPFYLARDLATEGNPTGLAANTGDNSTVVVPAGEAWVMLSVGAILSTFSGALTARVECRMITVENSTVGLWEDIRTYTASGVNDVWTPTTTFPRPFVAMAGTQFQAIFPRGLSAGTVTLNVRPLFQRLRA